MLVNFKNMKLLVVFVLSILIGINEISAQSFDWDNYYLQKSELLKQKLQTLSGVYEFTEGEICIQKIFEIEGDKHLLYNTLLEILMNKYNNLNDVLQVKDKDSGVILGKGTHSLYIADLKEYGGHGLENMLKYNFKFEVKDNKIRVSCILKEISEIRNAVIIRGVEEFPATVKDVSINSLWGKYSQQITPIAKSDDLEWIRYHEKRFGNLFSGFQFYYTIDHMHNWVDEMSNALTKKMNSLMNDNW